MTRRFTMLLPIFVLVTIFAFPAWAQEIENDFLDEIEAKKDMMAYVQSTFPYRFGNNLNTGDYVQYEVSAHHSEDSEQVFNSLEVTDRQNDVVTIKEEFDGNILFYKVNLDSNTLLEYWGFDEDGIEQRPVFLSENEVESRMTAMLALEQKVIIPNAPAEFTKPRFISLAQREDISIGRTNMNCEVKALDVPNLKGITPELKTSIQEYTKVLFSDSVPKMLPAKLMAAYMDNKELFTANSALVKESRYQLVNFNKSNN